MSVTRDDVVQFLYKEAELLDDWKLIEWAELFTEDGTYVIPPLGNPDATPDTSIFIVHDNRYRLGERAKRLLKKEAHVEYPHSTTVRNYHNIRVDIRSDKEIYATCNFTTHRTKRSVADYFIGSLEYELTTENGQLYIKSKKVIIKLDTLRPQGKVSLIL